MLIFSLDFWWLLIFIYYTHSLKISLSSDFFSLKYCEVVACSVAFVLWKHIVSEALLENTLWKEYDFRPPNNTNDIHFFLCYFIGHSVWFDIKDNIFFVIFGDEDTYTLRHYESSDFWLLWRHIDDVIITSKNSSIFFCSF